MRKILERIKKHKKMNDAEKNCYTNCFDYSLSLDHKYPLLLWLRVHTSERTVIKTSTMSKQKISLG